MTTCLDRTADLDCLLDRSQWVTTYPAGRTCRLGGCKTVLSIYNPSCWCAAHEPESDWTYHGRRFVICPDCGELRQVRRKSDPDLCGECRKTQEEAKRVEATVLVQFPHKMYRMELK